MLRPSVLVQKLAEQSVAGRPQRSRLDAPPSHRASKNSLAGRPCGLVPRSRQRPKGFLRRGLSNPIPVGAREILASVAGRPHPASAGHPAVALGERPGCRLAASPFSGSKHTHAWRAGATLPLSRAERYCFSADYGLIVPPTKDGAFLSVGSLQIHEMQNAAHPTPCIILASLRCAGSARRPLGLGGVWSKGVFSTKTSRNSPPRNTALQSTHSFVAGCSTQPCFFRVITARNFL